MSAHWLNDDGSLAWGLWVAEISDPLLPDVIKAQALYLSSEDAPGDSCTHSTEFEIYAEGTLVEVVTFDGCVAWRVS